MNQKKYNLLEFEKKINKIINVYFIENSIQLNGNSKKIIRIIKYLFKKKRAEANNLLFRKEAPQNIIDTVLMMPLKSIVNDSIYKPLKTSYTRFTAAHWVVHETRLYKNKAKFDLSPEGLFVDCSNFSNSPMPLILDSNQSLSHYFKTEELFKLYKQEPKLWDAVLSMTPNSNVNNLICSDTGIDIAQQKLLCLNNSLMQGSNLIDLINLKKDQISYIYYQFNKMGIIFDKTVCTKHIKFSGNNSLIDYFSKLKEL